MQNQGRLADPAHSVDRANHRCAWHVSGYAAFGQFEQTRKLLIAAGEQTGVRRQLSRRGCRRALSGPVVECFLARRWYSSTRSRASASARSSAGVAPRTLSKESSLSVGGSVRAVKYSAIAARDHPVS